MRILFAPSSGDDEVPMELAAIPSKGQDILYNGVYYTVDNVLFFPLPHEYDAQVFADISPDQ